MGHTHTDDIIVDRDSYFTIDTASRAITNDANYKKLSLMQYDHNSERFTFTMDRDIENHDIMDCNRVLVHYINYDASTRSKHIGIYQVDDMTVHPDDDTKVTFTWLISEQATHHYGTLSFLISFACTKEDETLYRWNSAVCSMINIAQGMNNSDAVVSTYADTLLQWEQYLANNFTQLEERLINSIVPAEVENQIRKFNFATEAEVDAVSEALEELSEEIDGLTVSAGEIDDVRVNGTSVVSNKVASITVPTSVAELTGSDNYALVTYTDQQDGVTLNYAMEYADKTVDERVAKTTTLSAVYATDSSGEQTALQYSKLYQHNITIKRPSHVAGSIYAISFSLITTCSSVISNWRVLWSECALSGIIIPTQAILCASSSYLHVPIASFRTDGTMGDTLALYQVEISASTSSNAYTSFELTAADYSTVTDTISNGLSIAVIKP